MSFLNALFLSEAAQDKIGFTTIIEERPEFGLRLQTPPAQGKTPSTIQTLSVNFLADNRSKDCVLKCVISSYVCSVYVFLQFYGKKIMAKMYVFYIKYLLIQNGKVRDICFDFFTFK